MIAERIFRSPNQRHRKTGVLGLVYHETDGTADSTFKTFTNPATEVSAHFLILRLGETWQFVDPDECAYGNGIIWQPTSELVLERLPNIPKLYGVNDFTISIEHESVDDTFTEEQYQASAKLTDYLTKLYDIPLDRKHLIRHNEIRKSKSCPGKLNVDRIIRMVLEIRSPGVQVAPITPITDVYTTEQLTKLQLMISGLRETIAALSSGRKLGGIFNKSEK